MIRRFLYAVAASLMVILVFVMPAAYATPGLFDATCGANSTTGGSAVCIEKGKVQSQQDNSFFGKNGVLTKITKIVALGVGVVSVIMIIVGGFKYVMASGDPSNIKSAKDTILYAIIGLVISAIAGSIVQYVIVKL